MNRRLVVMDKIVDLNIPKPVKKRKKRLTLKEYIYHPNADVDNVLRKKQKISASEWNIVHYFYKNLDNINYLEHREKFERLDFNTSECMANLIKEVLSEYKKLHLNESQKQDFKEQKNAYEQEKDAVVKEEEEKLTEGYLNIDKNIKSKGTFLEYEQGWRDNHGVTIKIVNEFQCQLCGSALHHVFVAQHAKNYKKLIVGRKCVRRIIPEVEWKKILENETKTKKKCNRIKKYIEINKFDLQEKLKRARITEESLMKQYFIIENTNPDLKGYDAKIKKAIDTLCILRHKRANILSRLIKSSETKKLRRSLKKWVVFVQSFKEQINIINNLSKLIQSCETNKLKRSLKKWFRFVLSFKEQITLKNISASVMKNHTNTVFFLLQQQAIKDRTNAVICLLQQQEPRKECYLELSNISLSVHKGYATYIKIYSDNNDILRTISRIEEELRCTRLTVPSYPLTLKHTDRTVFCTSNGVLMKPCFNQVYENCTVSILLKTYDFDNSTGVSRVCVSVRTSHIL